MTEPVNLTKSWLPPRASEDQIKELARLMLLGHVFNSDYVGNHVISVFLPLAFGGLSHIPTEQLNQLVIWASEDAHHTLRVFVNGLPIFTECRIWWRDDYRKAYQLFEKAKAAQEAALDENLPAPPATRA